VDNFNLVKGAIFGQAIGDALAHPIEFEKTHEVVDLQDDNKFTDDTQMFCAIGEAMLDAPPHLGVDVFIDALTARFIDWRKNPLGGSHRAPGGTCMEAVRKLGAGRHWRQSGATNNGKGNGSAMRAGIVGARYWREPHTAFRLGCLTSINTHNNLESILAAGMVAFLVARSIQGCGFEEAVAEGLRMCGEFPYQVPDYPTNNVPLDNTKDGQSPWGAIASFARGFILGESNMTTKEFLKENGNDFTAVPAVSEAIFFNTRHVDYNVMALDCANESDDSDTITAIAGTIAGARFGYDRIVTSWREKIEQRQYLEDLSLRIWEASQEQVAAEQREQDVEEALGEDYDEGELLVPGGDDGEDFEIEF
jgi:ADP-ribosyl-[dinitrogen reductase] hydrolase